ncbi:SAM-dependent methyltransferase, putative [Citrifermentans bemidjiense Bem]|uniref:SAM-dependent methyltransferase, putative n=1 Tax=Citrifermentans bemidjiense (strain ATCC BAA-1014 / DSM 16622 / JCM 12645 / Bem) TaxID=404380 RepID=B5E9G6_CITBB|nr:SAM-dependent methyltransferase, putative [Citrifermentans bemidjiense Bem]
MPETKMRSVDDDIRELSPWFHNLHLPDGSETAPDHFLGDFPSFKWLEIASSIPDDLTGWSALDIGCNAGFYSFELARRGARVLGIDCDPHYLEQARWAAGQYGLEGLVDFRQMQVYDLARLTGKFDLVLFMGVFYHLRYPMLALDIVAQKTAGMMLFQTVTMPGREVAGQSDFLLNERDALLEKGWPKMAFIEDRFAGDPTNWWIANHAGVEALLRSAGMRITGHPGDEIYLCEPDPEKPSCMTTWNRAEYLSATQAEKEDL